MNLYKIPNDIDSNLPVIQDNPELEVVTYINKTYYYFPLLLKSSVKYQYPLKILGYGESWKGYCTKWRSVYELILTYNNSYDDKYMLLVDGSDIMFTDYCGKLIEKIKKDRYDMIFSGSRCLEKYSKNRYYCIFMDQMNYILFNPLTLDHFINAGLYIIKIKILREIIEKYINLNNFEMYDDQRILNTEINTTRYKYFIDTYFNYGLVTYISPNKLEVLADEIKSGALKPFVIHLPTQRNFDILIDIYFPDITKEEKDSMRPNMIYESKNRLPHYFKLFINSVKNEIFYIIASVLLLWYL